MVIDGVNGYNIAQVRASNPTENPPMNNWSVNQPSPPHAFGLPGDADLGLRDIIVDGINFDLVQQKANVKMLPINAAENVPGNLEITEKDVSHDSRNI